MTASVLRARIGAAEVALPLERIDEILRMVALEPVAGAAKPVRGAMNLRGEIVVVLDIAPLLGEDAIEDHPSHSIVVVRGAAGRYGFLCSDAIDVAEVDDADRRGLASWSHDGSVREVVHVDGKLVPMLDPEALFAR